MKIAFRADSSIQMGTGHLVRCLNLADELSARGAEVLFVCREIEGHLSKQVTQRGFRLALLSRDVADQIDDAKRTVAALVEMMDLVVVDNYALGAGWERAVRTSARRVFAIDDLADRRHDCDFLLDQNFFADAAARYQNLVPADCMLLTGPRFAILGKPFRQLAAKRRPGTLRKVLIFFGGADPGNETSKTLKALMQLKQPELEIDIVIGAVNPHKDAIKAAAAELPSARCHVDIEYMPRLLAEADLCVGAGGTSAWERCRAGCPSLVIAIAENQVAPSAALAEAGKIVYLGRAEQVGSELIASALRVFCNTPEQVRALSTAVLELVDGQGARRVADALLPPPIILRRAAPPDCEPLLAWRNAETVRRHFFDPRSVSAEEHRRWFEATLVDPTRALLIAESATEPVGVLRYDFDCDTAKVSIYIVPGCEGRGLGTAVLEAGTRWVAAERHGTRRLLAEVKTENLASRKAFAAAGYVERHFVFEKALAE